MSTITYTLNKRDLTKEERESVSRYYRGLKALSDTITEEWRDDNGRLEYSCTYYIFTGSWTPYGSCVKHGNRYVFARYSRYDSVTTDFTDFAKDCSEKGDDHETFTTSHYRVEDMRVNC